MEGTPDAVPVARFRWPGRVVDESVSTQNCVLRTLGTTYEAKWHLIQMPHNRQVCRIARRRRDDSSDPDGQKHGSVAMCGHDEISSSLHSIYGVNGQRGISLPGTQFSP